MGRQTRSVNLYEGNLDKYQSIGIQLMRKGYYPKMLRRLAKQPKLAATLGVDANLPKALLEVDAYLDLKENNEVSMIESFKTLTATADELLLLIRKEINN